MVACGAAWQQACVRAGGQLGMVVERFRRHKKLDEATAPNESPPPQWLLAEVVSALDQGDPVRTHARTRARACARACNRLPGREEKS